MKQKLLKTELICSIHTVSTGINYYDAKDIQKIGYPVIFKAVDSSGSRGIVKVNKEDEIQRAKILY